MGTSLGSFSLAFPLSLAALTVSALASAEVSVTVDPAADDPGRRRDVHCDARH